MWAKYGGEGKRMEYQIGGVEITTSGQGENLSCQDDAWC